MGLFNAFDKDPKKGFPLSMKGVAEGLRRMARAWETLEIKGGSLTWNNGEPVIDVRGGEYSGDGGDGGAPFDYPGRVYLEDGDIKVTEIPLNFWSGDGWSTATKKEDGSGSWGALTDEYVYIQLDVSSGVSWTLTHNTSNPLSSDSQTQRSWLLAEIGSGGGITQHWLGAIYETMGG